MLVKLQERVRHKGRKVCIVFEGRDGAGQGGAINTRTDIPFASHIALTKSRGLAEFQIPGSAEPFPHALDKVVIDGVGNVALDDDRLTGDNDLAASDSHEAAITSRFPSSLTKVSQTPPPLTPP